MTRTRALLLAAPLVALSLAGIAAAVMLRAPLTASAAFSDPNCGESIVWNLPENEVLVERLRHTQTRACGLPEFDAMVIDHLAVDGNVVDRVTIRTSYPLMSAPILVPHPGSNETIEGSTTPRHWVPLHFHLHEPAPCVEPWPEPLAPGAPRAPKGGYHAKPCSDAPGGAPIVQMGRIARLRVVAVAMVMERFDTPGGWGMTGPAPASDAPPVYDHRVEGPRFVNDRLEIDLPDLRRALEANGTKMESVSLHIEMELADGRDPIVVMVTNIWSLRSFGAPGIILGNLSGDP